MKLKMIDSIMFYVKNLEESAVFYEKTLGLKRVWSDKKRRMLGFKFSESDSEIVIHDDKSLPNPEFTFLVDDVVACCKEFQKKGYKLIRKPFAVRTGKLAVLKDPDGNAIPIIDLTKFGGKFRYGNF